MTDVVVHPLERSRSQVLWLLEELGVDHRIELYERDPKPMRARPELAKIHPLGRSPVVTIGSDVLAESGADRRRYAPSERTRDESGLTFGEARSRSTRRPPPRKTPTEAR